ncbi:MAG TPA: IS982 family transposase [Pyrinomonadaceae bacterium]
MTEIYVVVDDFLKAHLHLAQWRHSPNDTPPFTDAEVLTIALMQGCLGVQSLKESYQKIADNYRTAFPQLCSYKQWLGRLHALTNQIGALLSATAALPESAESFYLVDSKPIPLCHTLRHWRVRLLREDGAHFGKTKKGWFFGFKLHALRHIRGRIVNVVLTPANWDDRAPALCLMLNADGGIALGDLGYRGAPAATLLAEEAEMLLLTRDDAAQHKFLLSQVRQAVETTFSQLWYKFIDRVFSRSWQGLWNTIMLKVIHYNLCHAGAISV